MLQGFDEPEFLDYMRRRREIARIPFSDETACLQRLFYHTHGNIHLARAALWAWLEMRAREPDLIDKEVDAEELATFLRTFHSSDACGMNVFFHTTRVVARSPKSWSDLENLAHGRPVAVA